MGCRSEGESTCPGSIRSQRCVESGIGSSSVIDDDHGKCVRSSCGYQKSHYKRTERLQNGSGWMGRLGHFPRVSVGVRGVKDPVGFSSVPLATVFVLLGSEVLPHRMRHRSPKFLPSGRAGFDRDRWDAEDPRVRLLPSTVEDTDCRRPLFQPTARGRQMDTRFPVCHIGHSRIPGDEPTVPFLHQRSRSVPRIDAEDRRPRHRANRRRPRRATRGSGEGQVPGDVGFERFRYERLSLTRFIVNKLNLSNPDDRIPRSNLSRPCSRASFTKY